MRPNLASRVVAIIIATLLLVFWPALAFGEGGDFEVLSRNYPGGLSPFALKCVSHVSSNLTAVALNFDQAIHDKWTTSSELRKTRAEAAIAAAGRNLSSQIRGSFDESRRYFTITQAKAPPLQEVPNYFPQSQLERFRLTFENGRLFQNGQPFHTEQGRDLRLFGRPSRFANVVLLSDGSMYAVVNGAIPNEYDGLTLHSLNAEGFPIYMHHSHLAGGREVAFAGEIMVKDGVLKAITRRSGHYETPAWMTFQFLDALKRRGVPTSPHMINWNIW